MDINEQRTTTLGAGTGLGATIDLLRVPSYAQGMGDVFQGCVNCSGSRFVDGRLYKWNENMQTWVCGDADASGTNCGESATYRFNWKANKAEQYDDGVRQSHWYDDVKGVATAGLQALSAAAGAVRTVASLVGMLCGAAVAATGPEDIPADLCALASPAVTIVANAAKTVTDLAFVPLGKANGADLATDAIAGVTFGASTYMSNFAKARGIATDTFMGLRRFVMGLPSLGNVVCPDGRRHGLYC